MPVRSILRSRAGQSAEREKPEDRIAVSIIGLHWVQAFPKLSSSDASPKSQKACSDWFYLCERAYSYVKSGVRSLYFLVTSGKTCGQWRPTRPRYGRAVRLHASRGHAGIHPNAESCNFRSHHGRNGIESCLEVELRGQPRGDDPYAMPSFVRQKKVKYSFKTAPS